MTQLPQPKKFTPAPDPKEKEGEEEEKEEVLKDSFGRVLKKPEEADDKAAKDSMGRDIKVIDKAAEKAKKVKMIYGKEEKQPGEEEDEKFVKHQSFENYLDEMKKRSVGTHLPDIPLSTNYRVIKDLKA